MFLTPGALAFLVEALLPLEPPSEALGLIARLGFGTEELLWPSVTTNLTLHARSRARAAARDAPGGVPDLRA